MVSRIVVNGPYEVWIEKLGQTQRCEFTFMDEVHLNRIIARIAQLLEARIDQRVPMLDRILPGGGRVRAKVPPLVPTGTLAIDKGPENPFQALLQGQEKHKWRQDTLEDLRLTLQEKLMVDIEKDPEIVRDRERLTRLLEEAFEAEASSRKIALSRLERTQLQVQVMNEILGLGPLEPLLRDPEITEIMVNGPDQVYVERRGKVTPAGIRFRDNEHIMRIIERILLPLGKRVDERVPMVDARLFDGSRVNIVIPPVALNGPVVTIRKFAREPFTVQDLISFGTFTPEVAQFFQAAVQGRLNIIVSGGTGSGKTTTLNVLSSFIPNDERIVTIEDTAELQLRQEHVVRLEARPPNIEGAGEVTIRDLVRNALRMRPDRIIVGECRGGEAFDMLQAMNTGHEGGMTTIHANNPREALARLSNMVLMAEMDLPLRAVREQIAGGLDLIIHQQRMRDGTRRVTQVSEITGMEGDTILLQDIFVFHQTGQDPFGRIEGRLVPTGIRPKCYERILERGGRLSLSVFQIS
ncbi:MAG: CpaF family protein [Armatimonadetes bacterium]|nr:CpaF family protein [Armatimonadota bacterium]MDW8120964.1 CpaF family protein [Armatimonadota bacterium]